MLCRRAGKLKTRAGKNEPRLVREMKRNRACLILFLIVLASISNIDFIRPEDGGSAENGNGQIGFVGVNGFPSVFAGAGCFETSTRISGVEGAFAVIATDNFGGVYVAYQSQWIDNSSDPYLHVYFTFSHDYGESWSESVRVDDSASSSVQCDTPSIAVDQLTGHVFVAWKDNRTGVARAYIDKSVNRGISFGSDVTVYDWPLDYVPMGLPYTVNVEVGDNGTIYVAWISYYNYSYTDCDILLAHSIDGGQTFSSPTIVNPVHGEARLVHPWIAIDGEGVIYVAYAQRNSTFSAVYLSRSLNEGSSFETPVKVNDDSTLRYRGGTQVNVSPDGKIHVVWTDGRAGDGPQYLDIFCATSLDGGLSFESNVRVNDDAIVTPPDTHPAFTRGAQGTPSIVTDSDSRVHAVWEDFRNFANETTYCRDIYYASSEDGTTFSKNLRANSVNSGAESVNCADPNIVIDSEDNLFIVYSDAPSGDNDHHQIFFMFAPSSAWKWTSLLDWTNYHNYTEITTILSGLNDTYSNILDVFSIGKSWRNRDIYCIRLTNENVGETKPQVLFVGYHHAQEQISAELPLYYVVDAATNYVLDENVTNLLNTREIYVIVALNVDGLDLFESNDRQRKNARQIDEDNDGFQDEDPPEDLNDNGFIEVLLNLTDPLDPELLGYEGIDNDTDGVNGEDWIGGVDLNRNYPIGWENAVSDPSSSVYRGPAPFSEPETQAIRDLVFQHNFTHAISFHSGLEFIIYPWGCKADPTPDDAKFLEIAQDLSSITGGTQYASPTVMYGIWDDWMYGEAGVLALTCEIFRNETWMDAFIEPGPYPSTSWVGGEVWLYNPSPSGIENVIQRWLPVFTYITLESHSVDDIPPEIGDPVQDPSPDSVNPYQEVTVWVNVTDHGSGTNNVTLLYSSDNGTTWTMQNMAELPAPSNMTEVPEITYGATIPGHKNCTSVLYKITAYDKAGNNATKDNSGYNYKYQVIPEFQSLIILPTFMLAILFAVIVYRRKHFI